MSEDERERWHVGGRHYLVTMASTPDTMDLELEDVGPRAGRGLVLVASRNDGTAAVTVRGFSSEPLPLALVEQFLAEARHRLPPIS